MNEVDVALSLVTCLSLREKRILRNNLDSLDALAVQSIEDISLAVGRAVTPEFWDAALLAHDARRGVAIMQRLGIQAVLYDAPDYPALLRETVNAPYMLFYRGNLRALHEPCLSVVGTRRPCRQAAEAAFSLARDAASDGRTVVSGLAYGIDSYAHKGAVSVASGATAAVLAGGVDQIVPFANRGLAERILQDGGIVLSEYVPGVPAEPWRFVQRNRIIAALSPATVVVQAAQGSGALITAEFALDANRELLFHSACFCDAARQMGKDASPKKANKRAPEHFVDSGAPVIENYAGVVSALRDAPGTHTGTTIGVLNGCKDSD